MTKTHIAAFALALALVGSLSACAVEVREPVSTPTADGSAPSPEATDDAVGGVGTSDCTGKDVTVEREQITVILSGDCGVVTISSSGATVSIDSADGVIVTGSENTVIMHDKAGDVTISGDTNSFTSTTNDAINVQGSGNQLILTTASALDVSGDGNFVTWSEGTGSANDSGSGNTLVGP